MQPSAVLLLCMLIRGGPLLPSGGGRPGLNPPGLRLPGPSRAGGGGTVGAHTRGAVCRGVGSSRCPRRGRAVRAGAAEPPGVAPPDFPGVCSYSCSHRREGAVQGPSGSHLGRRQGSPNHRGTEPQLHREPSTHAKHSAAARRDVPVLVDRSVQFWLGAHHPFPERL